MANEMLYNNNKTNSGSPEVSLAVFFPNAIEGCLSNWISASIVKSTPSIIYVVHDKTKHQIKLKYMIFSSTIFPADHEIANYRQSIIKFGS